MRPISDNQVRFWTERNLSSLNKICKLWNLAVCNFGLRHAYVDLVL
jgi:hypothetical protein